MAAPRRDTGRDAAIHTQTPVVCDESALGCVVNSGEGLEAVNALASKGVTQGEMRQKSGTGTESTRTFWRTSTQVDPSITARKQHLAAVAWGIGHIAAQSRLPQDDD